MDFKQFIENIKNKLKNNNFNVIEEKAISYGCQLQISSSDNPRRQIASINCYYSTKKPNTFKKVLNQKKDSIYYHELQQIFDLSQEASLPTKNLSKNNCSKYSSFLELPTSFQKMNVYAGSDESGKGDYFGPLVVCTFAVYKGQLNKLKQIGVKDSKLLQKKDIEQIAPLISSIYKDQFKVTKLMPELYNELYSKYNNLNLLLADTHYTTISNLSDVIPIEGVIVDKFANVTSLSKIIDKYQTINAYFVTKAERDLSVAAASILAKWTFDRAIEDMSSRYSFRFPKGGGNNAKEAVKAFLKIFGEAELSKVVKLHFKI
ncbi:MAG: ribonuclease HIII [Candidatus Cloacimonadales bacterium]|jgi:ribonuclease HIII|nr:ribonuclease HIII [Candidatus Cloacimonadota bacterium]MDD2650917.1 ribonuclease HIII [Candidatus Cloacimonadota bacterium]MDX9978049.1 ribonuclease HIII [Candidatus Cloacimonadales bacterium]